MNWNEENIINIFAKMASDGWNTDKPLKWGFFFFSQDEENLKLIFSELSDYGYDIESLHQIEDGNWVLQVSKTEILKSDKLHRRNIAFNELAEAYNSIYDGWDVEKSV